MQQVIDLLTSLPRKIASAETLHRLKEKWKRIWGRDSQGATKHLSGSQKSARCL